LGEGKQEFSFPHYSIFHSALTGTSFRRNDFIDRLKEPVIEMTGSFCIITCG